ncbi:MAG: protein serine/threonine phosphatase [Bacteroidetes bacterium]|jgi:serine phosphatase RsbU (regulator of sigma subunit)/Tfp pilus assembly protein PilF|nr:protein serine/threonine phosphatase [Bacteroidota bacterium]
MHLRVLRILLFTFLFTISGAELLFATETKIDSLNRVIRNEKNDSVKVVLLFNLFDQYYSVFELDSCEKIAQRAMKVSANLNNKHISGLANLMMGIHYKEHEEYSKAQAHLLVALKNINEEKAKRKLSDANSFMGFIQERFGSQYKAIEYHRTALRLRAQIHERFTCVSLLRIASCYESLNKHDSSLYYFRKGISIANKHDLTKIKSGLYNNIGITFRGMKQMDSAIIYYRKALDLTVQFGDSANIAATLINIGSVYSEQNKNGLAIQYITDGLEIAKLIHHKEWISNASSALASIYYKQKDYKNAFEMFRMSKEYADSIFNRNKMSEIAHAEEKYQSTKKQQELEIADLKLKMQDEEINKRDSLVKILVIGFILILILLAFVYRNYKQKKKLTVELSVMNNEIVKQKSIIEEKNKDITDSLHYAEKIQRSLLASEKIFAESFKDHFIMYKPKDIVSGDFYWAFGDANEILIANADCTGHGVPGAFMSLIGFSKLNEIVKEKNIRDTNRILDLLREGILDIFSVTNQGQQSKDGMDMVMMRFNFKTRKLQFSCANNEMWLFRKGEVTRYKADKFPVGFSYGKLQPFTCKEILLEEGDIIFTFSDGYADQFGGKEGKKFKYKNLEKIISEASSKPLSEVKAILEQTLQSWQGTLEQVDDVTVIGFRI